MVTHHGKPYALIQTISEEDLEGLGWDQLAQSRLRKAREGEDATTYKRGHVIVVNVPFQTTPESSLGPRLLSPRMPFTVTYRTLLFARSAASRVIIRERKGTSYFKVRFTA